MSYSASVGSIDAIAFATARDESAGLVLVLIPHVTNPLGRCENGR